MTRTKVADQRFSLKQWFAGGAQSRGLRKPGCGHCYLRFFDWFRYTIMAAISLFWKTNMAAVTSVKTLYSQTGDSLK